MAFTPYRVRSNAHPNFSSAVNACTQMFLHCCIRWFHRLNRCQEPRVNTCAMSLRGSVTETRTRLYYSQTTCALNRGTLTFQPHLRTGYAGGATTLRASLTDVNVI